MNSIETAVQTSNRGRKLTTPSVNMSRSIVKRYVVNGETQAAIAADYNGRPARIEAGLTLSNVAVANRITTFAARFPAEYASYVAQGQAKKAKKAAAKSAKAAA